MTTKLDVVAYGVHRLAESLCDKLREINDVGAKQRLYKATVETWCQDMMNMGRDRYASC